MTQLPLWEHLNATLDSHFPLAPKKARKVARARKSAAHMEAPCLDDFERRERREPHIDPNTGYYDA